MDCQHCQSLLLDLACGEIARYMEAPVRAHVAQCDSCRAALDKLTQGLQLSEALETLEPPREVREKLLQSAELRAATALPIAQHARPSLWQSLLAFVGRFAMARQVGMATVMMLIAAVGVWSLPQLKRVPGVPGSTVVSPEPAGEAAPSQGVQPAAPLDLEVDVRAGRIRTTDEKAQPQKTVAPSDPVADKRSLKGGDIGGLAKAAEGEPDALFDDALASLERKETSAPAAKPAAAAPSAFPASERDGIAPSPTTEPRRYAETRGAGAPSGSGNAVDSLSPPAEAELAKQEAASASSAACSAERVSSYERIVASKTATPAVGQALLALAQCRRAEGRTDSARALLTRALDIPSASSRARALLDKK